MKAFYNSRQAIWVPTCKNGNIFLNDIILVTANDVNVPK